ncbi:MAG: ATP-binding protein [Vicingaceae bacterium]
MKIPFEFGEVVSKGHFVNRDEERKRLKQNIEGGLSTLLISPRRWGKSSLVKQVSLELDSKITRFCFIDLFHIKDELEFYQALAKEVIKQSSSKWEEWMKSTAKFFKSIRPKISMGVDPMNDFEISFESSEAEKSYREVLDLAEHIAKEKKIRIVICVDEFQNLSRFGDPLLFQQRLRASWQHHKHVSYCLYGSKKHMMIDIFQNKSMPFYKFGDVLFLNKINTKHWVKYIQQQFKKTKKSISKKLAEVIVSTVENHSYYVQQLSLLTWNRTEKIASEEILEAAINDLLNQNAILFHREVEQLTNSQIGFLEALAQDEERLHSSQNIVKYKLGSSSNVSRIKEALENKEIIDSFAEKIGFLDPIFKLWFNKRYIVKK